MVPVSVAEDDQVDAVPGQATLAQRPVEGRPPPGMTGVDQDPREVTLVVQALDQGDRAERDRSLIGSQPVSVEKSFHVRAGELHKTPPGCTAR